VARYQIRTAGALRDAVAVSMATERLASWVGGIATRIPVAEFPGATF
jgi:hypothetical protein